MKKHSTAEQKQQLKSFRHEIAVLKRKGLLDKKYDARSVTPTKYLKSQVKAFSNVLEGTAQTVKVSKAKQAYYKAQGYSVKKGRVVVPVAANEKVLGTHGDFRVKTTGEFGSLTRIDLGLSKNDIALWKDQLLKRKVKLKPGESIYFQFYGNNSYQTFQNFEQLLFYFEQYTTVDDVERKGSPEDHMNLIENIVIYRIDRDSTKPPRQSLSEEAFEARRAVRAERKQKYLDRMTPERRDVYNRERAEQERERRERNKKKQTPDQIEAAKKKARERAKKSYRDRSGTNGKKGTSGN